MTRPVLLIEIGDSALPDVTPVQRAPGQWAPPLKAAAQIPPVPVVASPAVDSITISWEPSPLPGAEYVLWRAPDNNGAPGIWSYVTRTADTHYTYTDASGALSWWKVVVVVNGATSGDSDAVPMAPVRPPTVAELVEIQQALDQEKADRFKAVQITAQAVIDEELARKQGDVATVTQAAADATAKANAARDAAIAHADAIGAVVNDLIDADEWSGDKAYPAHDAVKRAGKLYRSLKAVPAGTPVSNTEYWELFGNYSGYGEALGASLRMSTQNASAIEATASTLDGVLSRLPDGTGQLATTAQVTEEKNTRAAETSALAQRSSDVEARLPNGSGKLVDEARLTTTETASATADRLLAARVDSILTKLPQDGGRSASEASVSQVNSASVDRDNQAAAQIALLKANDLSAFSALKSWKFAGARRGFTVNNANYTFFPVASVINDGALAMTGTSGDPQLLSPAVSFSGTQAPIVRAKVRMRGKDGWDGRLFWSTGSHGISSTYVVEADSRPVLAGDWAVVTFDLRDNADWTGNTIIGLRFDFGATVDQTLDVMWIEIGNYGAATGVGLNSLDVRTTSIEGTITSQSQQITNLQNSVATKAEADALTSLTSRVTATENTNSSQSTQLTQLTANSLSPFQAVAAWRFGGAAQGFSVVGGSAAYFPVSGSNEGAMAITATATDANLMSPALALSGKTAPIVRAKVRMRTGASGSDSTWDGMVLWATASHGIGGGYVVYADSRPTVGGDWVVVTFDMRNNTDWMSSTITQLRFDFGAGDGTKQTVDVMWIDAGNYGGSTGMALNSLDTRVTNAEGSLQLQSTAITQLQNAMPGKASADAVNLLTTRVTNTENVAAAQADAITQVKSTLVAGSNLIPNTDFGVDVAGWTGASSVSGWTFAVRDMAGTNFMPGGVVHTIGATAGSGVTSGFADNYSPKFDVTGNKRYVFAVRVNANRAQVRGVVTFYKADGSEISSFLTNSFTTTGALVAGSAPIGDWPICFVFVDAPVNAVRARCVGRTEHNGSASPYGWFAHPMFCAAAPGQTVPPDWTPSSAGLDDKYAAVTQSLSTRATQNENGLATVLANYFLSVISGGRIGGMRFGNDGQVVDLKFMTDIFSVLSPDGAANGFEILDGHTRTWRGDSQIIQGNGFGPDGLMLYAGPNVGVSAATKALASLWADQLGNAGFSGLVQASLLQSSAMEIGSTRIHTGGGRLAPFTIQDVSFASINGSAWQDFTQTVSGFVGPAYGAGYHAKRFATQRMDVFLDVLCAGSRNSETLVLEVQYNGGAWSQISTVNMDVSNKAMIPLLVRYTTTDEWDTVAFRARTSNGNSQALSLKVNVQNYNASANDAGSNSGTTGSGSGGGTPGTGGGGSTVPPFECVDWETTVLPDGRYVRDLKAGDLVECVDVATGHRDMAPLRAMGIGNEDCYLVSTCNAAIIQSASTPMDMRDGSVLRTPDLDGQELLTHAHGWQRASIRFIGRRKVCKPDFGNRMFFAGIAPNRTLATHNVQWKPRDP